MAELPRPKVWLNCAISLDGRLAYAGGRRARLSGPADLARVQRLRAESDAILVGVGTVILDDPSLRVHWELLDGKQGGEPLRVVLDSRGRTPPASRVLGGKIPTLIAIAEGAKVRFPPGVETFAAGRDHVDLAQLLAHLVGRGVRSVLVEGGSQVLASFLRQGLFDVFTVYVAPVVIGGATAPTMVAGVETGGPQEAVGLERTGAEPIDDGVLLSFRRPGRPT
jgi:2,5-diamino-6-(ribosylamino)-4(3H)-pyrimidinone 5'-phosphate reductase